MDGVKSTREIRPVKSTKNSFLYLSVTNKVLLSDESLDVTFYVSGNPVDGQIYYMVSNVLKFHTFKVSVFIYQRTLEKYVHLFRLSAEEC